MFEDFSLWPESAASYSRSVDSLCLFLLGVSAFFVALIVSLLILFSVRYRRLPERRASRIEGSLPLELLWTGVPLAIVLFIFVWGTKIYFRELTPPEEAMRFQVTAKQWMWKIQHPTGQSEINALHVPRGQPVVLTMISEDVIHSFFVPAFRVKKDVLPGMYSTLWFTPTRVGTYHLFCAEYCGTKHSAMIGSVVVMDPAEYQAWLEGRPAAKNPIEAGALLFQNLRCDTCHFAPSSTSLGGARGPELVGAFGTDVTLADGRTVHFDERHVRESLLEPAKSVRAGFQPLMPSYKDQISEADILDLIAYLKSLTPAAPRGNGKP